MTTGYSGKHASYELPKTKTKKRTESREMFEGEIGREPAPVRLYSKCFKNELGNDIALTIDRAPLQDDGAERFLVCLEGPSSLSENIITRGEALALCNALKLTV